MAEQLEAHIDEIERKRRELEDSIRRIGEAFGTGLDRQGLVDLAVRTAIEACDADAGRMVPVDSRELDEVRLVDDPGLLAALEAAERQVFLPTSRPAEPVREDMKGIHALAMPLVGRHDEQGEGETDRARSRSRAAAATSRSSSATCSPISRRRRPSRSRTRTFTAGSRARRSRTS